MDETNNFYGIAIIGGTGKEGKGLAYRWALAGHKVIIGSRSLEKAMLAADELNGTARFPHRIQGKPNDIAASEAEIIVITVPYSAHKEMCSFIKPFVSGKTVIDVTVPLNPPRITQVKMPPDGSAAQEALNILGPGIQMGAAFHNISYERLLEGGDVDCDVLVCGTSVPTRNLLLGLVKDAGLSGWDAGPIENSVIPEGLTSILIGINKRFGIQNAGIKITGVNRNS